MKTLKDIEEKRLEGYEGIVFKKDIKQEAIKLIKTKYNPDKTTMEIKDWIEFFNITEEDLE
ncbi:MAG TPA: hypothetical protein ENI61_00085 [Ignavibacteria bacterium]|nr:hypothetical protein [Ignavibacteria bacterium]